MTFSRFECHRNVLTKIHFLMSFELLHFFRYYRLSNTNLEFPPQVKTQHTRRLNFTWKPVPVVAQFKSDEWLGEQSWVQSFWVFSEPFVHTQKGTTTKQVWRIKELYMKTQATFTLHCTYATATRILVDFKCILGAKLKLTLHEASFTFATSFSDITY